MALKAPLGGWCPHFRGAQHTEITNREDDNALRVASTRHPELADLREQAPDRNVMSRLRANRPFASGQLGQRRDLPLTIAPLGGRQRDREDFMVSFPINLPASLSPCDL